MRILTILAFLFISSTALADDYSMHPGEKFDIPLEGGNTLSITLNSIQASGCEVIVQKLKFTGAILYSVSIAANEESSDPSLGWTASVVDENTCRINVTSEIPAY